jgi:hypothetical protein
MAYAVDNMEPMLWVPGDPVPGDVLEAVEQGWEFRAYNAQFERLIWQILVDREGFPSVPLESWVCTQAEARAMAGSQGPTLRPAEGRGWAQAHAPDVQAEEASQGRGPGRALLV